MDRWFGRVALVTGASSGIGAAIARELVQSGMKVVGCARRVDRIQQTSDQLKGAPGKLHALKCDLTKEEDILGVFEWIKKNLGGVDVLVNNAGIVKNGILTGAGTADMRQMLDVNILALSICSREAVKSMKERSINDGHIIHINSVAGHRVSAFPVFHFYSATKHAVTALTEALRLELVNDKTKIRVTSISPGLVKTEILDDVFKELFDQIPSMNAEDIADAVKYVLSAPAHVQVHEVTIYPAGSP